MKKAIYILLIMSSMGFTVSSRIEPKQQAEKNSIHVQTGYLEVSSPSSYSLTTGN